MSTTASMAALRGPAPGMSVPLAAPAMLRATSSPNYAPAVLSPQVSTRQVLAASTVPSGVATAPTGVTARMVSSTAQYSANGAGCTPTPARLQSFAGLPPCSLPMSQVPSVTPSVRSLSPRRPASVIELSSTAPLSTTMPLAQKVFGASVRAAALSPEMREAVSRGASARAAPLVAGQEGGFRAAGVAEALRDESELLLLQTSLEEKAILVNEYQRRNRDLLFSKEELERLLAARSEQDAVNGTERDQLRGTLRDYEGRFAEQAVEIETLTRRCDELGADDAEQARRLEEMELMARRMEEMELKDSQQVAEMNALRSANLELEQVAEQQAQRIAELEQMEQRAPARPSPPQSPHLSAASEKNLSGEDRIDRRIQEFFRSHPDFQIGVSRERAGFYSFDRPIGKRVSMKIVGEKVLARTGGGWTEVWEWLSQERLVFLEAEGFLTKEEAQAQAQALAPGKKRSSAAGRPMRAGSGSKGPRSGSGMQH